MGRVLIQSPSRRFDTRACSAIRATCSAGGYSSGQRGQTVNLLAYAYGGSSPSPPITLQSTLAFGERALSLHGGERPGCAGPRAAAPRWACTALAQRASSPFGVADGSPAASVPGGGRGESLAGRLSDSADAPARWWHTKLEAIASPHRCRGSVGRYSTLADVDGGHDDLDDVFHEDEFSSLEV